MRIERCGDRAFLIRLGEHPHPALSRRIATLRRRLAQAKPAGLDDAIAGFVTLLVMYDPDVATAEALRDIAEALLRNENDVTPLRTWTLPVCYDASVAPDLPDVAAATGLTLEEVARLHAAQRYTVYLLGFSPGFAYMGNVDERLVLPRRADPRPRVPAGSVAIATTYTAVYPQDTAGGWHLIGRTPVRMFDPRAVSPALLSPGDEVCFRAVSPEEYETLCAEAANGLAIARCTETPA